MKVHSLKTWPPYFQAVKEDLKTFEIRKNDRGFSVGDILHLIEFNPEEELYTGEHIYVRVTFILEGGQFGIDEKFIIMGITKQIK